ncbi:pectinesterase-like [Impatiens glandulifera]|uniref:pectinesterase-like n=1 Tax=Impatiens glandulifera TaxID=253017 RepID=UPI001FB0FCC2|nr:pectinesterase-like [Impatiens glandulifera]
MDINSLLTLYVIISISIVSQTFVHGSISLCDQAPYPDLCHDLILPNTSTTLTASLDQTQFSFRDVALRATLERAENAHNLVSFMNVSSFDERAMSAWSDCLELYEDTVDQLNRCINSNTDSASAQTWLSAAIANQQTCVNGFDDFQLSSHFQSFFPPMVTDVSKLLSNSLFINKAVATQTESGPLESTRSRRLLSSRGFPGWVSTYDRRLLQSSTSRADVVVAQDGSGNYKTITEAVAAAAKRSGTSRYVIHVKAGTYKENIEIKKSMKNLMFIGDGKDVTIVTGSKNVQDGSTTFKSATFAVSGPGFIARDMTFENTAGPQKHQAVALRSGSDLSIFYSCSFKGYQDTLYVYSQRQFYRNCDIYGTVDFIFGDATAVIQNSNIYARKPMSGQKNTITAQGRSDPNENTGIVIHNSIIAAAENLGSVKTYLGRPWKQYSRTVVMKSTLGGLIDPAGWLEWSGNFALNTLYYGEYLNSGTGASTSGRVKWGGYHVITSSAEAGKFTVGNFLAGGSWISSTGVPFSSGL